MKVNMHSERRQVLFVIFIIDGHTYQLIWEPGFEYFISEQVDRWIEDDELGFNVDNAITVIEAALEVARKHNAGEDLSEDYYEGQDEW